MKVTAGVVQLGGALCGPRERPTNMRLNMRRYAALLLCSTVCTAIESYKDRRDFLGDVLGRPPKAAGPAHPCSLSARPFLVFAPTRFHGRRRHHCGTAIGVLSEAALCSLLGWQGMQRSKQCEHPRSG